MGVDILRQYMGMMMWVPMVCDVWHDDAHHFKTNISKV
jgi:hypothetical protein